MANQTINVIVNSRGVVSVVRDLNMMGDAAKSTSTYLNGLRQILSAALTFSGIGQIVAAAEQFTLLSNKLRIVATVTETVAQSWGRLLEIANNSYSLIDSTVDLYFKVSQAFKAWGESAEEAYEFTNLFQKAAILSGSSMQTTAQAVYQFGQALNKGKLDGDEFKSVLEGLPYVAQLIQKELGVTRSELYEMSAAGEISMDRLKNAFTNAAKVIAGDWANVTPTIGMALVVLNNQWIDFIGRVQTSTGIFSAVAYAIILIANNFDLLAIAMAPVAVAMAWMAGRLGIGLMVIAFRDMATVIKLLIPQLWLMNAAMLANPYVLAAVAIAAIVAAIIYFRNELGLTNEVLTAAWELMKTVWTSVVTWIQSAVSSITAFLVQLYEWTSLLPVLITGATMLYKAWLAAWTFIIDGVHAVVKYLASSFIPVIQQIIADWKSVSELVGDIILLFVDSLQPAIKDLKAAWDILSKAFMDGLTMVNGLLLEIWEGWKLIGAWLKDTFGKVVKDVFDGWILILRKVLGFINNIISALKYALSLMAKVGGAGGGGGGGAHYGAQFNAGEGFANGGGFKVGGTGSGRDTTPVAFRAERGERVTVETKKQQRQNDNQMGAANVNVPVSIVNVTDPGMVLSVMSTAEGNRNIINVIEVNATQIKQLLGVV